MVLIDFDMGFNDFRGATLGIYLNLSTTHALLIYLDWSELTSRHHWIFWDLDEENNPNGQTSNA